MMIQNKETILCNQTRKFSNQITEKYNQTTRMLYAVALFLLVFVASSCTDEQKETHLSNDHLGKGFYVLCQGNIGHNNSALDFYNTDSSMLTKDIFTLQNSQGLGDVANDIVVFGDKVFVTMEESACVAVINLYNAKLIKRIAIVDDNGKNRIPFCLAKDEKKVYLCSYDGNVLSINPNTLVVEKITKVGRNPEGICYAGGNVYISNSGGMEYQSGNYDSTISVVSCSSMTQERKITVGKNPGEIKTLNSNLLGVVVRGNYSAVKFLTISTLTNTVQNIFPFAMNAFDVLDNKIIYSNYDYATSTKQIKTFEYSNPNSAPVDFIKDHSILNKITLPSNIIVDIATNRVFITDAMDYVSSGKIWVFDTKGNFLYSTATSNIPWKVITLL